MFTVDPVEIVLSCPCGRAYIANTALRIFLQEMGEVYDRKRGREPYNGKKDFAEIRRFFDDRCCYCGEELRAGYEAQDHLIPTNRENLGLHAWGNVVRLAVRACEKTGSRVATPILPNAPAPTPQIAINASRPL